MAATSRKPEDQQMLDDLFMLKPSDGALMDYVNDRLQVLSDSGRLDHAKRVDELVRRLKAMLDDC